jgi:hypothetical protein
MEAALLDPKMTQLYWVDTRPVRFISIARVLNGASATAFGSHRVVNIAHANIACLST